MDTYKDNKFTIEQWVYNFIVTNTTVNNILLTTIKNTGLILVEKLSYIIFVKQLTSTEIYSYTAISLSTLNIYCT